MRPIVSNSSSIILYNKVLCKKIKIVFPYRYIYANIHPPLPLNPSILVTRIVGISFMLALRRILTTFKTIHIFNFCRSSILHGLETLIVQYFLCYVPQFSIMPDKMSWCGDHLKPATDWEFYSFVINRCND